MPTHPNDTLKDLSDSLRNVGPDPIRFYLMDPAIRRAGTKNITNTVMDDLDHYDSPRDQSVINDILVGVARTTQAEEENAKPLSVAWLYSILLLLPLINTKEVMWMLNIGKYQAQRYVWAAGFSLPFLNRHFAKQKAAIEEDV